MHHTILFACPHNAAKSALAVAYVQRLAQQYTLDIQAISGETEPDAEVAPAVAELLRAEGLDSTFQTPRLLTQADIDRATCVITLSCPLDRFNLTRTRIERWDDVSPASENLQASRDAIVAHVQQLIGELQECV